LRSNLEHGVEGSIKDLSSFSSSDAARLIHADGVHILAHLDGHTANARNEILALRPAPIQVGFILGFPGTFGADYIDYLVLDRIVLGPLEPARKAGTSHDIDECALILPNSCILNCHALEYDDLFENPGARPGRSKYGLPEDAFIFAYFGQLNKVDPIAYGVWMSILKRVPNSILLLIKSPESAVVHLKKAARDLQVHEQRLIFMDSAPKREHILRGVLADLLLDTPACNAFDATMDALWTGTPVVTLLGNSIATRASASLCTAVGCPDLVTSTLDEYEDLAVSLALDADKYWLFRQKLEHARRGPVYAPLYDCKATLKHLEAGFEAIWGKVIDHQPPGDIIIS
jgi:protein O-GlcNAc transferase